MDDRKTRGNPMWSELSKLAAVAVLMVISLLAGCADEVEPPVQHQVNQWETNEKCPEGKKRHPVTRQCVEDLTVDNEFDNEQNDPNGRQPVNQIPGEECGPGAIQGQACRPDGEGLPAAEVTLEGQTCEQAPFEMTVTTDENGYYEFDDVPAGEHILQIESGSFDTQQPVRVTTGETTDLEDATGKVCVEDSSVSIAVIGGEFDDIGEILARLQLDYDVVGSDQDDASASGATGGATVDDAVEFLGDRDRMMGYDILFIACGTLWPRLNEHDADIDALTDNIGAYVEAGNSVYASDWAHPFVQLGVPEVVEFYDEDDHDPTASWRGDGDGGMSVMDGNIVASVTSEQMETLLGTSVVQLYLVVEWAVANQAGEDSTVHFEADVPLVDGSTVYNAPMMVTYEDPSVGGGQVIFTSFHNAEQGDAQIDEIMEFVIFQL